MARGMLPRASNLLARAKTSGPDNVNSGTHPQNSWASLPASLHMHTHTHMQIHTHKHTVQQEPQLCGQPEPAQRAL